MIPKILAGLVVKQILQNSKNEVVKAAQSSLIAQEMKRVRALMLQHVAEKYTEEVTYNIQQYIKTLEQVNVEISFEGKPGETLIRKAQAAFKELEVFLDKQNPDGPIIQYLQRRYDEEGVNIITGRLYGGHYVSKRGQGIYEVANKMGYAADVDKRKPWLSSEKTSQGIDEIVSEQAIKIFEQIFESSNLSEDDVQTRGMGFGGDVRKPAPKPRRKKRRR